MCIVLEVIQEVLPEELLDGEVMFDSNGINNVSVDRYGIVQLIIRHFIQTLKVQMILYSNYITASVTLITKYLRFILRVNFTLSQR